MSIRVDSVANFVNDSIAAAIPYKVYRALLTQSGTDAPVATVLENTLGNIVWTRIDNVTWNATLAGAFPVNKTVVPPYLFDPSPTTGVQGRFYRTSDNVLTFESSGDPIDDAYSNVLFEILVYP